MTRARAGLLLAGMFVLGLASGVLGTTAYTLHHMREGGWSHGRMEGFVMRRLTRRLDLDENQRKTLQEVIHKTRLRLEAVHDEVAPRIEAILDDAYQELLPSLNPDQQKKLETIREEARRRHERRRARIAPLP